MKGVCGKGIHMARMSILNLEVFLVVDWESHAETRRQEPARANLVRLGVARTVTNRRHTAATTTTTTTTQLLTSSKVQPRKTSGECVRLCVCVRIVHSIPSRCPIASTPSFLLTHASNTTPPPPPPPPPPQLHDQLIR